MNIYETLKDYSEKISAAASEANGFRKAGAIMNEAVGFCVELGIDVINQTLEEAKSWPKNKWGTVVEAAPLAKAREIIKNRIPESRLKKAVKLFDEVERIRRISSDDGTRPESG